MYAIRRAFDLAPRHSLSESQSQCCDINDARPDRRYHIRISPGRIRIRTDDVDMSQSDLRFQAWKAPDW